MKMGHFVLALFLTLFLLLETRQSDPDADRKTIQEELDKIKGDKTELRFALAASMIESKESVIKEWKELKEKGIVKEDSNGVVTVETDILSLKKVFKLLQFYPDIYEDKKYTPTTFEVPIGGELRKFRLATSTPRGGVNQIVVSTSDADWPGSTPRAKKKGASENSKAVLWKPDYDTMVDGVLKNFPDHKTLATNMLEAIDNKLKNQPAFSANLQIKDDVQGTKNTIRATVEFMVISMIAEAAQPSEKTKAAFIEKLATQIRDNKRGFPKMEDMPSLETIGPKSGRSPTMDEIVRNMLQDVKKGKEFHDAFSGTKFPARNKGGAQKARKQLHDQGNVLVATWVIRKRSAEEHDKESVQENVKKEGCRQKRPRVKRASCTLEDRVRVTVDEESIKITDSYVEFDVVNRRDAKRSHTKISLESIDLATPKLIKEYMSKSHFAGAPEAYAKINKGLAVHGLIFSFFGVMNYFSKGDNVRGTLTLSQSVHTLGGLTGINEVATKVGRHLLSRAAKNVAKGLNLEKGLERFSTKVERYMERGVGKLLGAIPIVGLAFDVYFVEQDIEELANLNLNDAEDVKLLPLRIIDLSVDISTTVLNLIGTFCPEAEVITEPLIIYLSIIRMAIDDFYIDIMGEMEKVNWKSPWAGLQFLGALEKGVLEGAADFLTGGLRRQMESYRKQENYDKKLRKNLANPDSYYKIVGERSGSGETIDFTEGKLSSFGGYINFRLLENNRALLEIGDISGSKHKTIRKTLKVDSNLKNIVLGVGESRGFTYKHEMAKLFFVIPVKSYNLICGANLHEKSVYGTYYGNSKNNKFYAVQKQKPTTKKSGKDKGCNFGDLSLKFVTGNYHYNLYGRGGSDTFYLGPELSKVTGGDGNDLYIIQSDGGKTIIDNFAQDAKRDIIIINVNYSEIHCHHTNEDLDITYSKTHHIRIKNWFANIAMGNYYRHVSFRSKDGIIFIPEKVSISKTGFFVKCVAVVLDLSSADAPQAIFLTDLRFKQVKQVSGSNYTDNIVGNDVNNILDGGRGKDYLSGGRNEDTYIIRANEGCDVINNDADDYFNTTDILVFDVPFDNINITINRNDLSVFDGINQPRSCFSIENWALGYRYRHILFTSSDHVVFNVSISKMGSVTKVPIILDYKNSPKGVCVDLSELPSPNCIKPAGFSSVATVSDSPYDDFIVGNNQSNFLSCSGGKDYLEGRAASDNYVVKKSCIKVVINNTDGREKSDLLFIEENFKNLQSSRYRTSHLLIKSTQGTPPAVVIRGWFDSSANQHLGIRTLDGITLRINNETGQLEPIEVSKDPAECLCKNAACQHTIEYDLTKAPWTTLTRFRLNSSHCSYKIYGNHLNNYLDPGAGNGYNYQHLEGKNGSDTYVFNHGYGEFNEINNYAKDKKQDALLFGLEFDDIQVYFHDANDVILASKSRPSSLSVQILNYFRSEDYQHLHVVTADKISFEVIEEYPYKNVITVDRTSINSPQSIKPDTNIPTAEHLKGSLTSSNELTGSKTTQSIEGGAKDDILLAGATGALIDGKGGNDKIYGGGGNDIIYGGYDNDVINAGAGDDSIFGGSGEDIIDGGDGTDTIVFKGDGFLNKGVRVDLYIGFGEGADAEGDTYKNIENVYGTIHNDRLTGSDSNNKLYGIDGNDTLIAHGGDDQLSGGEGKDLYILYQASGLKLIDNYADDEIEDTLSLPHVNSTDVCIFLLDNDLYFQVDTSNLASALFSGQYLTVMVINWKVSEKYRHLSVVFSNTLWKGIALSAIASKFDNLNHSSSYVTNQTALQVFSTHEGNISLSWQGTDNILSNTNSKLFLVNFDKKNPKRFNKTQVNAGDTSMNISVSDWDVHYVFALELKQCRATVAVSHTVTTFGQERACSKAQFLHSSVKYVPKTSTNTIAHGIKATVKCDSGYNLENESIEITTTCLDREWVPSLPVCKRIMQCQSPSKLIDGKFSITGLNTGSKARYYCKKGYRLSGARERKCNGKTWNGTNPSCQPLHCPRREKGTNGEFYSSCIYMKYASTHGYGTINNPLEGYCVKLQCPRYYLASHEFRKKSHISRWDSNWKIPHGGITCSDGKWVGNVNDQCELIAKLTSVNDFWHKKTGLLELWENGRWSKFPFRSEYKKLKKLSCASVGINEKHYVDFKLDSNNERRVTCSKLRFASSTATPYEGRVEALINGNWKGVCFPKTKKFKFTRIVDVDAVCNLLGVKYNSPSVISSNTGWTEHALNCPSKRNVWLRKGFWISRSWNNKIQALSKCTIRSRSRQQCGTMVRCRQRCSGSFPVPHGKIICQGKYEGDTCRVKCYRDYKLKGASIIYCTNGYWFDQNTRTFAAAHCEYIETLYKDDVLRLVKEHKGKTKRQLAILILDHLRATYSGSYWLVTVYNPIGLFENHYVVGHVFYKFRYYGFNIVVTRYPNYVSRPPKKPLSSIVGSISGSNARSVGRSIEKMFSHSKESFTSIHVIRRRIVKKSFWSTSITNVGVYSSPYLYARNFFFKSFSNVVVIIVAPGR